MREKSRHACRVWIAAAAAMILSGARADAQVADARVGLQLAPAAFVEAWDDNGSREWIAAGLFGVWTRLGGRWAIVVETSLARVAQARVRDAFVLGLTPVVRFDVARRRRWTAFVEIGPGVSWSDTAVPERGTRFNYLGQAGAGVVHGDGPRARIVAGARWWHLSNNGREGRDRNPDIQAVGGYAGVLVGF